jgi:hypothetical protein
MALGRQQGEGERLMLSLPGQPDTPTGYLSYLLRLWYTQSEGAPVWRAWLENPLTRDVLRFATLADLFTFLGAQAAQDGPGDSQAGEMPLTRAP